jgi:hypothetical protein
MCFAKLFKMGTIRLKFYNRHLPPETLIDIQFSGRDNFSHFFYLLGHLKRLIVTIFPKGNGNSANAGLLGGACRDGIDVVHFPANQHGNFVENT